MVLKEIYIRADANRQIATGHIMRCLAIAQAFKGAGIDVHFIVADQGGKTLSEANGFSVVVLESHWDDLEYETNALVKLIQKKKIEFLIIDSYYVTRKYLLKVKEYTKVLYIDDWGEEIYPCDVLLNYSVYADEINYERYQDTTLLLGEKYALLRDEFKNIERKIIKENIENVVILTGGTDPYHFACNIMSNIACLDKNVSWHIVCGKYNEDAVLLKALAQDNVYVYVDIKNIKELMLKADVAISAGGSTLYELCACGTPVIVYTFADNQFKNAQSFEKKCLGRYVGDLRYDAVYDVIIEVLKDEFSKKNTRECYSRKMQELVDGFGTDRIVNYVMDKAGNI